MMFSAAIYGLQTFLVYRKYQEGKSVQEFVSSAAAIQFPASRSDQRCFYRKNKARLEPDDDQFLWGFSVQWDVDDAVRLSNRLGKTAPIFNTFININNTHYESDILNWQSQQVQRLKGMLEITIMPNIPVGDLTDLTLYNLAVQVRKINSYYGVPVFLRFAPEMNGESKRLSNYR